MLTVSAGDNTMGTLATVGFRTDAIDYGVMVSLGYDVTTLGNHELDYGPEALAESLGADGKPTTCADAIVYDSDNREVKEAQAFMTLLHSFPSGIPELYDSQAAGRSKRFDAFPACH